MEHSQSHVSNMRLKTSIKHQVLVWSVLKRWFFTGVSQSQIVLFMWFVHFWPLSLVSKNPPQASSVLSDKVDVICRRSRLRRRSWEFQPCWMQKTWWLLRFLTASVSWHTSPSFTTTSMDAPRVSITMSHCVCLRLRPLLICLYYIYIIYVFAAVGGMGGMKRPAEGPTEGPSGKKNQPVVSKMFPSSKPARENSPPPSSNNTRPPPSPKKTRIATQVTFPSIILHTRMTELWITFESPERVEKPWLWNYLTDEKWVCQVRYIKDDLQSSVVSVPNCYYKMNTNKKPTLLQIS